jgi:hypothetical protein
VPITIYKLPIKLIIYSSGVGIASFIFVLLINIIGPWFGFKRDVNVPIQEIDYLNIIMFLACIGLLATITYGFVFYIVNKIFKFRC